MAAQVLAGEPLPTAGLSAQSWLAVLLSGAIGLGASFVLLLAVIRRHGPTAALLLLYVVPLSAAGLGCWCWARPWTGRSPSGRR